MDPASPVTYRPLVAPDLRAAYAVFRRSLFDYLLRIGQIDAATAANPAIDEAWLRQGPWVEHLARRGRAGSRSTATSVIGRRCRSADGVPS
jgi:hypothetical protein